MPPDLDLDADWADLRTQAPEPIQLARNDLPGLMEMALAKTQHDLRKHIEKLDQKTITSEGLGAIVALGVKFFWEHLTAGTKGVDTVGLIEIILSTQGLPANELKQFVRGLPRTLLDRIIQSKLGAQAGGIHALLALEVLVRDGRENDYNLVTLPSGGIEVTVNARAHDNKSLSFRLDETFAPPTPSREVESNRAETSNAADLLFCGRLGSETARR